MASNTENSHGSTWATGHLQRDKDGCPAFPGEAYTVTQFNTWLREFRGYAARKGQLSALITGQSDEPSDTPEGRQLANRRANSALYGLLMRSMAESATELASEIESRFLVTEPPAYADGYEAVQYLRDRVKVDSFHRNDVIEKRILKLLRAKTPDNCTRDVFRTTAGQLRELNKELISGRREGAALSAAYFQLLPVSIRESKHALETRLKTTPLHPGDPTDDRMKIDDPVTTLAELEDLVERVNLDQEDANEHAAYMASVKALSVNIKTRREGGPREPRAKPEKRKCPVCKQHHAGPCFGSPAETPELPGFLKEPKNAKWYAKILEMRKRNAAPAMAATEYNGNVVECDGCETDQERDVFSAARVTVLDTTAHARARGDSWHPSRPSADALSRGEQTPQKPAKTVSNHASEAPAKHRVSTERHGGARAPRACRGRPSRESSDAGTTVKTRVAMRDVPLGTGNAVKTAHVAAALRRKVGWSAPLCIAGPQLHAQIAEPETSRQVKHVGTEASRPQDLVGGRETRAVRGGNSSTMQHEAGGRRAAAAAAADPLMSGHVPSGECAKLPLSLPMEIIHPGVDIDRQRHYDPPASGHGALGECAKLPKGRDHGEQPEHSPSLAGAEVRGTRARGGARHPTRRRRPPLFEERPDPRNPLITLDYPSARQVDRLTEPYRNTILVRDSGGPYNGCNHAVYQSYGPRGCEVDRGERAAEIGPLLTLPKRRAAAIAKWEAEGESLMRIATPRGERASMQDAFRRFNASRRRAQSASDKRAHLLRLSEGLVRKARAVAARAAFALMRKHATAAHPKDLREAAELGKELQRAADRIQRELSNAADRAEPPLNPYADVSEAYLQMELDATPYMVLPPGHTLRYQRGPTACFPATRSQSADPSRLVLVDSGAALDFCNDSRQMRNLRPAPEDLYVQTADKTMKPTHVGDWLLLIENRQGGRRTLVRHGAVLAPTFASCLLSVGTLIADGIEVRLSAERSELIPRDGSPIPLEAINGTFCVRLAGEHGDSAYMHAQGPAGPLTPTAPTRASDPLQIEAGEPPGVPKRVKVTHGRSQSSAVTPEVLHSRLGHFRDLTWLPRVVSDEMPQSSLLLAKPCDICLRANGRRISSNLHATRPPSPGEACVDFWGPFAPSFNAQHKYAIGFIDVHSRHVTIYLSRTRDSAPELVERYVADMRAVRVTVRRLHLDNAAEFTSERMHAIARERSFQITTSCEYESNQNGLIERTWQTLQNMCRAMLLESGLPKSFWGWAMLYASTIYNRTPKRAIEPDTTPHELQTGVRASIGHLRPFGCLAFPRELRKLPPTSKLDPRSEPAIHLGYSMSQSGYLILYPHKNVPITTTHVVFREDVFPTLAMAIPTGQVDVGIPSSAPAPMVEPRSLSLVPAPAAANLPVPPVFESPAVREADVPDGDVTPTIAQRLSRGRTASAAALQSVPTGGVFEPALIESPTAEQLDPDSNRDPWAFAHHASIMESAHGKQDATDGCRFAYLSAMHPNTLIHCSAAALDADTPRSHAEAVKSPQRAKWLDAEAKELATLQRHGTWELVPKDRMPPKANLVKSTWSYKVKRDKNGEIAKFKARLCAQGFTQKEGIDFDRTFSPTMRHSSLRLLTATSAQLGLQRVATADFTGAYLNAELPPEQVIYMRMPPGYAELDIRGVELVCMLRKCLYGLKQSGRHWHFALAELLTEMGFTQLESDPCLFVLRKDNKTVVALGIYVDDLLIFHDDPERVKGLVAKLQQRYELTYHPDNDYFLGLNLATGDKGFFLSQSTYISGLVGKYLGGSLQGCKTYATPCDDNLARKVAEAARSTDPTPHSLLKAYQSLIGALMYAATSSRPDVAYAVGMLARAMTFPNEELRKCALRIVTYLAGTAELGLTFRFRGPSKGVDAGLSAYSDSDWATESSTSGVFIRFNGTPVVWISRRQACIAMSSMEAEVMASSTAALEIVHARQILVEMGLPEPGPTPLYGDNTAAIDVAHDPMHRGRAMHIERRHLKVRELVSKELIAMRWVPTQANMADALTKALGAVRFTAMRELIGMRPNTATQTAMEE